MYARVYAALPFTHIRVLVKLSLLLKVIDISYHIVVQSNTLGIMVLLHYNSIIVYSKELTNMPFLRTCMC